MSADILEAPRYCIAQAARLTGLTASRASRWLRGYRFDYKGADGALKRGQSAPVARPRNDPESTYVSFLDLMDLVLVRRLLALKVGLGKVRDALREVQRTTGRQHYAHDGFFVWAERVYYDDKQEPGLMLELLSGGQTAFTKALQAVADQVEKEKDTDRPRVWFPRGKNGPIMLDPRFSFGRPVLTTRHIPTEVIYDLYLGESENVAAAAEWYGIGPSEVEAAVEYERRPAA